MIRVLVAEDSATVRLLLVSVLSEDPEIEVVGEAASGEETVRLTERLRPDVITMDIHMPGMGGIEATKVIMERKPTPIIIVSSAVRDHDVAMSLQATSYGAVTAISKPDDPQSAAYRDRVEQLIVAVKTMSQVKVVRRWRRGTPTTALSASDGALSSASAPASTLSPTLLKPSPLAVRRPIAKGGAIGAPAPVHVVAIAASTGGPAALQQTLKALPKSFPAPVLIVQHIADGFINALVSWLRDSCALPIKVAEDGEAVVGGHVYVAPHGKQCGTTAAHRITLLDDPAIEGFRPSATHLFRSVAKTYGANAMGIIMTGMGRDGIDGLKELHSAGGWIIAQDEATSVVYGMPQEAVRAGVVHDVRPINEIATAIIERTTTQH